MNLRRRIETPLQSTSEPELPARAGKTGGHLLTGGVMSGVQGRDSNLGFRTELENLVGMLREKAQVHDP